MKYSNDEVFEYRSTLFKASGSNQESYLQLLYTQRNKWSKFVMDALIELLTACTTDPSRLILHYIFAMEPPTYLQARYMDWIRPFI